MQYVSCGKGHYFNPEEHASCPQCARESMMGGGAAGGGFDSPFDPLGPTMDTDFQGGASPLPPTMPTDGPLGGIDPVGPTQPASTWGPEPQPVRGPQGGGVQPFGPTEPAGGWGFPQAKNTVIPSYPKNPPAPDPVPGKVQDYENTAPVGPAVTSVAPGTQSVTIQPVVGWLVCVEGAAKGRDFRIHSQYNYIGRARHMDICIEGDSTISSEKAAILAYDDQQRIFFFAPGQGRNLVRVNERAVLTPVELQAYDRLTIGRSTFLFIPLCGERFDWNEQKA